MMVPLTESFTTALFAHFTASPLWRGGLCSGLPAGMWCLTARLASRRPQHHRALPKRRPTPAIEPIVSVVSRTSAFRELALEDRQHALHAPLLVLTDRSERAGVNADELPQQPLALRRIVRAGAGDQLLDGIDVRLMSLVRVSQGHGRASSPNPISPSLAQMSTGFVWSPWRSGHRRSDNFSERSYDHRSKPWVLR